MSRPSRPSTPRPGTTGYHLLASQVPGLSSSPSPGFSDTGPSTPNSDYDPTVIRRPNLTPLERDAVNAMLMMSRSGRTPNTSPARSTSTVAASPTPSFSQTVAASSASAIPKTIDADQSAPKRLTLSEYAAWKASGLRTYSAYQAWKEDHPDLEPPKLPMMKASRPNLQELQKELERRQALEKKNRWKYRNGWWGTTLV